MFLFDVRMSFKNFMGAYMIIVPLAILLILRIFIPSLESSAVTIAVVTEGPNAVDRKTVDMLDSFADIAAYPTIEAMEQ